MEIKKIKKKDDWFLIELNDYCAILLYIMC